MPHLTGKLSELGPIKFFPPRLRFSVSHMRDFCIKFFFSLKKSSKNIFFVFLSVLVLLLIFAHIGILSVSRMRDFWSDKSKISKSLGKISDNCECFSWIFSTYYEKLLRHSGKFLVKHFKIPWKYTTKQNPYDQRTNWYLAQPGHININIISIVKPLIYDFPYKCDWCHEYTFSLRPSVWYFSE